MATKKGTTRKSSSPKAKTEKLKKSREISSAPKGKNGGARPGAGRKKSSEIERLVVLKEQAEEHALQEAEITVTTAKGAQLIKMQRSLILLDVLFNEGVKRKNIPAIKEYFDRTRGKARQPIEHSGEIKTEDQYIPDDPATKKAHEVYVAERKKLIAQGYYADGE